MLVVQASLAGNRIDELLQYETIGQRAGRTIGTEQAIRLTLLRDGQKTDVGVRLQAENQ
jgi:hypothetical protein